MFIAALFIGAKSGNNPVSINWWMNKQNAVYPYNGVLSNHKKECSTDTCYNVNEPWKQYAKWEKPDTKGHILYYSFSMKCPEKANP